MHDTPIDPWIYMDALNDQSHGGSYFGPIWFLMTMALPWVTWVTLDTLPIFEHDLESSPIVTALTHDFSIWFEARFHQLVYPCLSNIHIYVYIYIPNTVVGTTLIPSVLLYWVYPPSSKKHH